MRVILTGWSPGLRKISLSDLLRGDAGYSLKSAKSAVDQLLDNEPVSVDFPSREAAVSFLQRAVELGALGHLDEDIAPR
jgi:hypothetical protein